MKTRRRFALRLALVQAVRCAEDDGWFVTLPCGAFYFDNELFVCCFEHVAGGFETRLLAVEAERCYRQITEGKLVMAAPGDYKVWIGHERTYFEGPLFEYLFGEVRAEKGGSSAGRSGRSSDAVKPELLPSSAVPRGPSGGFVGADRERQVEKAAPESGGDPVAPLSPPIGDDKAACPHGDALCPCPDGDPCHCEPGPDGSPPLPKTKGYGSGHMASDLVTRGSYQHRPSFKQTARLTRSGRTSLPGGDDWLDQMSRQRRAAPTPVDPAKITRLEPGWADGAGDMFPGKYTHASGGIGGSKVGK